ncbi:zinc-finger of c2h2 type [Holotrichia oblita]|uniref:Zinc-finger of c2h2 type n=1 Tax=Holotrichia oblita TaxID=644536 RepID=A0ACB9TWX9_HOLOL|nr:zinc-finger of c2h2 type [Holotrichia oblita]
MSRGRGYSSSRGSSYRGSSSRGSWGGGRGNYSPSRGSGGPGRFSSSFGGSFDSRNKYGGSSDRYPIRGSDDYRKPYRPQNTFVLNFYSTPSCNYNLNLSTLHVFVTHFVFHFSAIARRSLKKSKSLEKEESGEEKEEEEEEEKKEKGENEAEGEVKEGTEEDKEKAGTSPKKVKKEGSAEREDKKSESGSDEKSRKRPFIKLMCPHCLTKCPTFARYSMHLQSGKHMAAMRRIAIKQKAILSRMRVIQRNAQRELEKTTEDLAPRTNFCPLCKLNYKQPKATHQASEAHKNMKKFLMPYCKVCKITFKSPMLYESHCCMIDHLKRKAIVDDKSDKEGSGLEDNLENFMTIDSVGEMEDEETTTTEKKKEETENKPKEQINVGIEKIKKVEVYYCDLCRMYLPRGDEADMPKILAKHCRQRTHLQRYVRYKEDKELTKRAERLQRKETAEKEKEKVKEETKADDEQEDKKPEVKENGEIANNEDDDGGEEKLWADVDKDLGDILAEAGSGNKSSDEDEEDSAAAGERFDRFKLSEKEKKAEEKKIAEAEEKSAAEAKKESEVATEK